MGFSFFDNARTFYLMRFIFGAAEAGFVPGIILYLTYFGLRHSLQVRGPIRAFQPDLGPRQMALAGFAPCQRRSSRCTRPDTPSVAPRSYR
jgi:hypothetical protein